MRSALYYPHTTMQSSRLLKNALLLWDKIQYIVPYRGYQPAYTNPLVAEAMEIIGEAHYPTDAEKKETHAHIEDFVTRPLPEPFYFMSGISDDYDIYPQKLLPDTWEILVQAQIAGRPQVTADYPLGIADRVPLSQPAGLSIMAILADCCAGTTRHRITDRSAAYATLAGLLGAQNADVLEKPQESYEQLVPVSLEVLGATVGLKRLIDFRKREERPGGHTVSSLRHRYVDSIESYVKTLTTVKGNESDRLEIERQFKADMKNDLADLRAELGLARNEAMLSQEMLADAVAGLGTVAAWALGVPLPVAEVSTAMGTPVTIGGLLRLRNKYLAARYTILRKHPTAYLYSL